MKKQNPILMEIIIAAAGGMILGAILSLFGPGAFLPGWLKTSLLTALLLFALIRIARSMAAGKTLVILMAVTFLVRIAVGVFLYQALPQQGSDNPVQQAGYVFADAHERDQAAFQLASSHNPWLGELKGYKAADQYGGFLTLSALVYRIFSMDVHRPLLIVLVTAFAMAAGLACLYTAIARKWNPKLAVIAGWIFALYPDGILLGSSQMREPVLIALTCLLFYTSLAWKEKPLRTLLLGLLITLFTCLFSVPGGFAALAVVAGLVFFDWMSGQENRKIRTAGYIVFAGFVILAVLAGWFWLKETLAYEYYLTESLSGVVQVVLERYGSQYRIPLITFYGLTQPLLPAALVDPSKPLSQAISILRASGWYFLIPFVVYGFFAVFKSEKKEHRSMLIFLSLAIAAWVFISSLRGGGDQWDNPRYRATFLPWMALLAGWVWLRLGEKKRPWFWRIVAVEAVFVLVLLNWYLNRYYDIGTKISDPMMILLMGGLSLLIIAVGVVVDIKNRRKKSPAADR